MWSLWQYWFVSVNSVWSPNRVRLETDQVQPMSMDFLWYSIIPYWNRFKLTQSQFARLLKDAHQCLKQHKFNTVTIIVSFFLFEDFSKLSRVYFLWEFSIFFKCFSKPERYVRIFCGILTCPGTILCRTHRANCSTVSDVTSLTFVKSYKGTSSLFASEFLPLSMYRCPRLVQIARDPRNLVVRIGIRPNTIAFLRISPCKCRDETSHKMLL